MIGPHGLFDEWLRLGPREAAGPASYVAARALLVVMLAGVLMTFLLVRWYMATARRRDFAAHKKMQWALLAAMWLTTAGGMAWYFWYLSTLGR